MSFITTDKTYTSSASEVSKALLFSIPRKNALFTVLSADSNNSYILADQSRSDFKIKVRYYSFVLAYKNAHKIFIA